MLWIWPVCSRTGHFEHVKIKSNFVTCGKILKYLRKCNLLQEDPDTLQELANGSETSGDWTELRNCTWRRLFRILSGILTVVKTFQICLGSCSWMHFNIRRPISYFSNYSLVILSLDTEYPELQRVSFHVQLGC